MPLDMQASNKLRGLLQEGHLAQKWGEDEGGSLISPGRVAPSRIVSVSSCSHAPQSTEDLF